MLSRRRLLLSSGAAALAFASGPLAALAQSAPWLSRVQAWVYPGQCAAAAEYADGRVIHVLKPQYFTAQPNGTLYKLTVANGDGCNAWSAANVADVTAHSREQYTTVAGTAANMRAVLSTAAKRDAAITKLVNFAVNSGFTGIEIDFEQVSKWTAADYAAYLDFVARLGTALHAVGKKLMLDCPANVQTSGRYVWRYADFNALPVDYLCVMEYDWQWDFGAGTPVAPFSRETSVTNAVLAQFPHPDRLVVGLPSYGYHGPTGSKTAITIDTNAVSRTFPGYATATRDPNSGELVWAANGVSYVACDSESMNQKRALLESLGVRHVSVWHLGGNQWFGGRAEPV